MWERVFGFVYKAKAQVEVDASSGNYLTWSD